MRGVIQGFLLESARNFDQISEEHFHSESALSSGLWIRANATSTIAALYPETAEWLPLHFTGEQLTDFVRKMIQSYLNNRQDDSSYLIDSKYIACFQYLKYR